MTSHTHKRTPRRSQARFRMACTLMGFCLTLPGITQAEYRVLHHFGGGANDGARPYGSLIHSGSTLYGLTAYGGSGDGGFCACGAEGNDRSALR